MEGCPDAYTLRGGVCARRLESASRSAALARRVSPPLLWTEGKGGGTSCATATSRAVRVDLGGVPVRLFVLPLWSTELPFGGVDAIWPRELDLGGVECL
jgi:hypothetical protein